ncbi:family 20 glycosylhydrolase [Ktedonospora formicarum]|uniref:family 20 glycosylhydrolase n=1 Tax=Ktedonospora formicarum TaxID=2778364 RepID=UPI001C689B47|nr:family 20 glycosylhydrolase [Ktedonospora formicarum]
MERKRLLLSSGIIIILCLLGIILVAFINPASPIARQAASVINPAPNVIPSLREWRGATGEFELPSNNAHIVINSPDATRLQETAKAFQEDLRAVNKHTLPIITATSANAGDFFLTLHSNDIAIGNQGYQLSIGDSVTISAITSQGAFYGTRSILQILVQDDAHSHLPRGWVRDYPSYALRGFMLDVGRKFVPLNQLKDYVKLLAWYKLNDFHLHLNDNQFEVGTGKDWKEKYSAFRLKSEHFEGLEAQDGAYSKQDMRQLQDLARAYSVTITPEIDAPAHALAFTKYRPDLASTKYDKDFLDLNNPKTYTFMDSIWDEFLPWFDAPELHIGVDEYAVSDADNYRRYINHYISYLKQHGKKARIWGSLSEMKSSVAVNTDATLEVWNNSWSNPIEMKKMGFRIINANDKMLYIVPQSTYYQDHLNTQMLYEKWEPYIFDLNNPQLNFKPDDPQLEGAIFAEWNDQLSAGVTEAGLHERIKPAAQVLSEKMWGSTANRLAYEQFKPLTDIIDDAPGTNLPNSWRLVNPPSLQVPPHTIEATQLASIDIATRDKEANLPALSRNQASTYNVL